MKYNTSRNILLSAVLIFCLSALTIAFLQHKDMLSHEHEMQANVLQHTESDENEAGPESYTHYLDNKNNVLLVVKPDRNLSYISDNMVEEHGFLKEELIGENVLTFVHPKDLPQLSYNLVEYHKNFSKVENLGPIRVKKKSGEFLPYLVTLIPQIDKENKLLETVVILKNVSSPLGDIEETESSENTGNTLP